MKHLINFRWQIKQTGERQIEVLTSPNGQPLLAPEFARTLTDAEVARAEHVIIRELVVLED